jgi:hypothetical protein
VLVRTFLSWTLAVEIKGHWPWQPRGVAKPANPDGRLDHVPGTPGRH